jgi:hypothetical protein
MISTMPMPLHPFQQIVDSINNSGVQESDAYEVSKFADQIMARFAFDDTPSSRRVFVRDDLPYVLKIDEEAPNSNWLQNHKELDFYRKIKAQYPQYLSRVPQIYWVSKDTRFMFVEKIPFSCDEGYDLPHIQASSFYQVCRDLRVDVLELSKMCSWRFRDKVDDNSFVLVDAGC